MRVEAGSEGTMGEERDEFPIGMRVLAVDDNLTCLKILEAKLRICRYNVTTTNQAIEALKMLRENRDKFDLIITDVHMPDMDGYKLLEHVGLEMDLPVIMLSADGDDKAVMKGITHGACDYLLKPVRIEELKNIWQHVIRKKKSVLKEHSNSDNATSESSVHKVSRKRKDQNEDEEDDNEENTNKAENKKSRTVWTQELHQKFVQAMMGLGPTKAVPKRILEHMNVEGLTRENVASHLQKYRLYLKKVENQASNIAAALGRRDSYLPLAAVDSFGDFHSFTSSNQVPCFPQNGAHIGKDSNVLGHNNVSHGIVQVARTNNVSNTINNLAKFQHGNLMQRMPSNLEVNQMQQKRMIQESNGLFVNPLSFHARQTSIGLPSTCLGPYQMNSGVLSNNTWQSDFPTSSGGSPVVSQINCNPLYCSSSGTLVAPASHPMIGNIQMVKEKTDDSKYLNFGNVGNTQRQWRDNNQDLTHDANIVFSSFVDRPLASNSIVDSIPQGQRLNSRMYNNRIITNMNGQTDGNMLLPEQCNIGKSIADGKLKDKDEYFLENPTLQDGLDPTGHDFDDLFNMY